MGGDHLSWLKSVLVGIHSKSSDYSDIMMMSPFSSLILSYNKPDLWNAAIFRDFISKNRDYITLFNTYSH
jgi:hypothetical protein